MLKRMFGSRTSKKKTGQLTEKELLVIQRAEAEEIVHKQVMSFGLAGRCTLVSSTTQVHTSGTACNVLLDPYSLDN